jgi:4-amino-4-deoxychorismate lyase
MHAAADIPPSWNRAIAYGDGLFETILVLDGVAPLWGFHRARLQQSIQRLNIHCDVAELEKSFLSLATQHSNALIKIIVARSGGIRGYSARQSHDCVIQLKTYPLPHYARTKITDGVRLHVCRQRLSHNSALAGIKHLNRLEQVMAASELRSDWADEGLMLDNSGSVIEGTSSNIFIVRNGILETPRLDYCGVAGVMRTAIMQKLAQDISLPVQETRLTLTPVLAADAVFICNSVFGVWPVKSIGVSTIKQDTKIIEKLWQQLTALGYARLYV